MEFLFKNLIINIATSLIGREEGEEGYNSGKLGIIEIQQLEVGKSIRVWEKGQKGHVQTYTVGEGDNEFIFEIAQPLFSNATIKVVNEKDEIIPDFPVLVDLKGETVEFSSGETGIIRVKKIQVGLEISFKGKEIPTETQTFTIVEDENENVFVLKVIPKLVTVKLVNKKGESIPGIPIDFTFGGKDTSVTTNEKGICTFPHNAFTDKEKVKAVVRLPKKGKKDKEGRQKEKRIKKGFTFEEEQLEYIIKLKPNRWWLLLLLLPLLLLIRCEKDVHVRTLNAETLSPVAKAEVQFQYKKHFVYDTGDFFTNDTVQYSQETDSLGLTGLIHDFVYLDQSKSSLIL